MNTRVEPSPAVMDDARSPTQTNKAESEITLGLLNAIQENSAITQRSAARDLGIALGLANAYLKRCVKKGLVKVSMVPSNRYAYYLTPKGFAEKSRLTAEYLSQSFRFFRTARNECSHILESCAMRGWRRLALCGTGDLAEIITLCARDYPVEFAGIVDRGVGGGTIAGLRVTAELESLGALDAVVVSDLSDPQGAYEWLAGRISADRILAPALLKISRERQVGEDAS